MYLRTLTNRTTGTVLVIDCGNNQSHRTHVPVRPGTTEPDSLAQKYRRPCPVCGTTNTVNYLMTGC